jgi:hypothetical protein
MTYQDQAANGDFNRAADGILDIDYDVVEVLHNETGPYGHPETVYIHRDPPLSYRRPWQRSTDGPSVPGTN